MEDMEPDGGMLQCPKGDVVACIYNFFSGLEPAGTNSVVGGGWCFVKIDKAVSRPVGR